MMGAESLEKLETPKSVSSGRRRSSLTSRRDSFSQVASDASLLRKKYATIPLMIVKNTEREFHALAWLDPDDFDFLESSDGLEAMKQWLMGISIDEDILSQAEECARYKVLHQE